MSTGGRQANWKHSIAGGIAGSVAVSILHPFDVIKTRLQVQDGHLSQLATYRGSIDAAVNMYRRESWRAFYNGLTPALVGSGVAWSAYFYAYESIKEFYLQWQGGERLGTMWNTLSAAQAGAMVCLLTNPIWLIKTRLQLQQNIQGQSALVGALEGGTRSSKMAITVASQGTTASTAPSTSLRTAASNGPTPGAAMVRGVSPSPYKGFLEAFIRIGREEGIRGYYKGLAPSLVLTCHGAIQFTIYEELKHFLASSPLPAPPLPLSHSSTPSDSYSIGSQGPSSSILAEESVVVAQQHQSLTNPLPNRQLSSLETSICAMLSKLSASVITYPSQVVRSRLQQRFDNRNLVYSGAVETLILTWRSEGVRGFYRGLGPALMRTLPQSALTLTVYEKVLQILPP